jgi:hypothetical protein
LPAFFLLLCANGALSQASAPPIVTVRSAPERLIVEVRETPWGSPVSAGKIGRCSFLGSDHLEQS